LWGIDILAKERDEVLRGISLEQVQCIRLQSPHDGIREKMTGIYD